MGVTVSGPTVIYADNLSTIRNSTDSGSPLKEKYLALSYHFYREHFSARIVNIQKFDAKNNYTDPVPQQSRVEYVDEKEKNIK